MVSKLAGTPGSIDWIHEKKPVTSNEWGAAYQNARNQTTKYIYAKPSIIEINVGLARRLCRCVTWSPSRWQNCAQFKYKILWHNLNCLRWYWFRTLDAFHKTLVCIKRRNWEENSCILAKHLSVPSDGSDRWMHFPFRIDCGMLSSYSLLIHIAQVEFLRVSAVCCSRVAYLMQNRNQFRWREGDKTRSMRTPSHFTLYT